MFGTSTISRTVGASGQVGHSAAAGLSCALGLSNTPSLLEEILLLAGRTQWLQSKELPRRVCSAIKYFYPDGTIADRFDRRRGPS